MSPQLLETIQTVLGSIIAALGVLVVTRIQRQTDALDRREKRDVSFDATAQVELEARKRPMSADEKLRRAVRLANEATPSRIEVGPNDIEAVLPRVRASLPSETVLESLRPGEPIPVTVVLSIPADAQLQADALPTLPRPAPLPKGPLR